MRLVSEAEPTKKWKKVPLSGSSKHAGGLKTGEHESGWHKRQRPKGWKNVPKGAPSTAGKKKKLSWRGSEGTGAHANYFLGNDPHSWRRNVPLYSEAKANVAPGVKMLVYGNADGFEYDLKLQPGTDDLDVPAGIFFRRKCANR